jgi:hypothetical protein
MLSCRDGTVLTVSQPAKLQALVIELLAIDKCCGSVCHRRSRMGWGAAGGVSCRRSSVRLVWGLLRQMWRNCSIIVLGCAPTPPAS